MSEANFTPTEPVLVETPITEPVEPIEPVLMDKPVAPPAPPPAPAPTAKRPPSRSCNGSSDTNSQRRG